MEQHPIPQNVTTFQFRLIGDMTIKQFGYLAGGLLLGYICYKLPLPVIITWPLAILVGLLGIGLAFVPVEERPMDIWILSFIKSVYSPTLFLWQKSAHPVEQPALKKPVASAAPITQKPADKRTVPVNIPAQAQSAPPTINQPPASGMPPQQLQPQSSSPGRPQAQTVQIQDMFSPVFQPSVTPSLQQAPNANSTVKTSEQIIPKKTFIDTLLSFVSGFFPKPAPKQTAPTLNMDSLTQSLTGTRITVPEKPQQTEPAISEPKPSKEPDKAKQSTEELTTTVDKLKKELAEKSASEARLAELQKKHEETKSQKAQMEAELAALRQKPQNMHVSPPVPIPPPPVAPLNPNLVATAHTPTVRIVTPDVATKVGLPRLTTFPNVVTGIIKDSDNNLLPGVLVTIRDKNGLPLRALKSNKLGQIAASTPLPNGTYTVEVEDPRSRFVFDRAQITLTGSVMPAIEIIAKSQRDVMRTKLEKEIFGSQMK